jgi:hypothetical protein
MQELRYKVFSGLVVAGLVLLTSLSVHAQDWEQSFPPQALASHLPYQATRVLVITAGQLDEDTNRLQKALISRINGIDDATAVTIPSLNGRDVDDRELLASVEKIHPDVILIVRLFNPENSRATAIGTFYGSDKEVVSAFALEEGQVMKSRSEEETSDDGREPLPLPKKSKSGDEEAEEPAGQKDPESKKQRDPSEGVTSKTAEAVSSIGDEEEQSSEVRRDTLEHGELMVTEVNLHNQSAGGKPTKLYFYRGVYKEEISPQQFLEEVGRPELIGEYEKRKEQRTGLFVASAITGVAGSAMIFAPLYETRRSIRIGLTAGGALFYAASIVGLTGALVMSPFPLSASEARKLAYQHNKKLEGAENMSLDRPRPSVEVGAGPMGNGAGFVLKATF